MTQTRVLKQADRCDRCGAQAFIKVLTKPEPLMFCGHHYADHADALGLGGYFVVDERLDGQRQPV